MKQKNKIAIVMVIIGIVLIFAGLGLMIFNNKPMVDKKNNNSIKDDNSDEKKKLDEQIKETDRRYAYFFEIGKKLYDDESYLKYPFDAEGMGYYITIGEFKKMGYDPKLINPNCTDDDKIINFDIENASHYEGVPVAANRECILEVK